MSKFVIVKLPPKELNDGCIVIGGPDFRPEINQCARKKPRSNVATINYLREVVATIGLKYAGEEFNALTDVNLSKYVGMPCATVEETNKIVYKAFTESYPAMFDKFVEYHIKHRPPGTKLVYFLGGNNFCSKFIEYGLEQIKEKDVPVYLGLKEKKVVGKPAVSNKDLALKNKDTV